LAKGRAKVVVINSSWQLAPWADVLYACDFKWWDVHAGVPKFKGLKISQDGPKFGKKYPDVRHIHCDHGSDALLMAKFGTIGWGGNSGFNSVNLVAQFGVAKMILVGFDMRMDKGLHWHGKHAHNLNNPTEKNLMRWCKAIDNAAPVLKSLGIQVFNTSPISKLNNYHKVSLEEALGSAANGNSMTRFTAMQDFWSDETKSQYMKGLSYTVHDGNDKLAALVQRWTKEGKVELGGPAATVKGG